MNARAVRPAATLFAAPVWLRTAEAWAMTWNLSKVMHALGGIGRDWWAAGARQSGRWLYRRVPRSRTLHAFGGIGGDRQIVMATLAVVKPENLLEQ
jgi:hypothetical protein